MYKLTSCMLVLIVFSMSSLIQAKDEAPAEDKTPEVTGLVVSLNQARAMMEISIGADDGVKPLDRFDIYQNRKIVGQVEIVKVTPDKAVARILKVDVKNKPQKGNRVERSR